MTTFSAYSVAEPNAPILKVEKELPSDVPSGQVRIKVKACGLCHSDIFTVLGLYPGVSYPRAPGHEVAGIVDAVGPDVKKFKPGERVGIGWFGANCNECRPCEEGDFIVCPTLKVTGIHFDGGYSEYVTAPATSIARIPDEVSFTDAAPLMCAGVTVYNGLRRANALPGDVVAVQGIGGLGHLAIQFANKMGYKVVVFSRGQDKKDLALSLGGHYYFDTNTDDIVAETAKLGGVKVLLATSTSNKAIGQALPTLGVNGTLVILGASVEPLQLDTLFLIGGRRRVVGHPSGTNADSEDTMNFAALTGVKPMNEVYPIAQVSEAYDRMLSGNARFRVVVDWTQE